MNAQEMLSLSEKRKQHVDTINKKLNDALRAAAKAYVMHRIELAAMMGDEDVVVELPDLLSSFRHSVMTWLRDLGYSCPAHLYNQPRAAKIPVIWEKKPE